MNKPIIILKNDALFIDGEQFDGFALFATKDDGNGEINCINFLHGDFSIESAYATIDAMANAVGVFVKNMNEKRHTDSDNDTNECQYMMGG